MASQPGRPPKLPQRPPPPFPQRPIRHAEEAPRADQSSPCYSPTLGTESLPPPLPPDIGLDQQHQQHAFGSRSLSPHAKPQVRSLSLSPSRVVHGRDFQSATSATRQISMPIIRNVPSYERPSAYAAALRESESRASSSVKSSRSSQKSRAAPSPIDQAIQRELIGDGIALEEVVANKRSSGWAVRHRQAQRNDLGHFCYGCGQPLRDLNEEVTVWTGAAIYRRFHPACAASYVLRADGQPTTEGSRGRLRDVVEGYADGWRAPRESVRPVEAARQWLLSEDQRAWGSLRGDLFTTVTVNENGKKKAVPGLSFDQLRILQIRHRWQPDPFENQEGAEPLECAVCFCAPDPTSCCVRLPCAPQHVFHLSCVLPWLKKASLCPTCRRDLRPLLKVDN
mmetsp:Transcript_62427/g.111973  ORF Transcript_62427/g.111973 Transcript_62427/m.111973 type:complete len:395 (+) Transcript_62427:25-1209(+)